MRLVIKRLIRYCIVVVIMVSFCISVLAKPFSDVSTSNMLRAYFDGINYVSDKEIMNGTSNTVFSPDSGTSRAMVAVTLFRMSGDTGYYGNYADHFSDVNSSDYFYNAVGWAFFHTIIKGTSSTHFSPNTIITRQQLMTIL